MKSKWGSFLRNWTDDEQGRVVSKANFNTVFIPFLLQHFKYAKNHVIKGFCDTGLMPFKFENADLSKNLVKKRKSIVNFYEGINIDRKTE